MAPGRGRRQASAPRRAATADFRHCVESRGYIHRLDLSRRIWLALVELRVGTAGNVQASHARPAPRCPEFGFPLRLRDRIYAAARPTLRRHYQFASTASVLRKQLIVSHLSPHAPRKRVAWGLKFHVLGEAMGYQGGFGGLIVLIADVWAIVNIFQSSADTGNKVLWTVVVLVLPLLGFILWYIWGPKTARV